MSNSQQHPRTHISNPALVAAAVTTLLPHVAFASVGAGSGLPYEDTFAKIVTSLTGPWAWTVAIVCVVIFAYNAIQRGGDLGGSTMAFLGPAFICTLLLGTKKLMTFFGQGALLASPASLLALAGAFTVGVIATLLMLGSATLTIYRAYQRLARQALQVAHESPTTAGNATALSLEAPAAGHAVGTRALSTSEPSKPELFDSLLEQCQTRLFMAGDNVSPPEELRAALSKVDDAGHALVFSSPRSGKCSLPIEVSPPAAAAMRSWPRNEISK